MSSVFIAWSLVGVSVVSEVIGTVALKYSNGFTNLVPSALAGIFYVLAVWLMSLAMRQLEMSLTYAVWAAGGAALTALVGILFYGEVANSMKFIGLTLVIAGVVALNLSSKA